MCTVHTRVHQKMLGVHHYESVHKGASRRVARIWKRGGYFEKVRKVQTTLTRILIVLESVSHGLSENSDEISRKARKFEGFFRPKSPKKKKKKVFAEIESDFSAEIRNSKVFSAQKQVVSKKKVFAEIVSDFSAEIRNSKFFSAQKRVVSKKKRSSPKLCPIFRPKYEFKGFFRPKTGGLQKKKKKKKKVFAEIESDFSAKFGNSNVSGEAVFLWGGLFSIFHKKSASKALKTCDFEYFTSQWGGSSPPPPPWLRYWVHHKLTGNIPRTFKTNCNKNEP